MAALYRRHCTDELARQAGPAGEHADQWTDLDLQPGLFAHLADEGLDGFFVGLDPAAGQAPAALKMAAPAPTLGVVQPASQEKRARRVSPGRSRSRL